MNFERGMAVKQSLNIGKYRNRSRQSGITTRAVDDAIQSLFLYKKIIVPTQSYYMKRRCNSIFMVMDPCWEISPSVQNILWEKIKARLFYEHRDMYTIYPEIRTIALKNI